YNRHPCPTSINKAQHLRITPTVNSSSTTAFDMPCIRSDISRGTSYRKPRLFNDGSIPTAEYNPSIRQALMLQKLLVRHGMNRFCAPSEIGILFQPRSIHDAFDLIRLVALIDWNNSPCSCPSQHLFLLGQWPCQIHEDEMNQWPQGRCSHKHTLQVDYPSLHTQIVVSPMAQLGDNHSPFRSNASAMHDVGATIDPGIPVRG
ncbi:hypothetical protein M408DRAFT_307677, partial [Serendipita vermifera MAFF 305830]